ncbi:conserved hypothetical protein [Ricinus communis]|uniref:Uncharacterized protein n=1 Tax=Ricinus communis TaxID=3988 RepID=B9SAZ9_RICCO|nr:conserved hypothetical protein [Ricinus communis]
MDVTKQTTEANFISSLPQVPLSFGHLGGENSGVIIYSKSAAVASTVKLIGMLIYVLSFS